MPDQPDSPGSHGDQRPPSFGLGRIVIALFWLLGAWILVVAVVDLFHHNADEPWGPPILAVLAGAVYLAAATALTHNGRRMRIVGWTSIGVTIAAPLVLWVAGLGVPELNGPRSAWTGLGSDFYYAPLAVSLIGLVNAGIVRTGATPVQFGVSGSLDGWPALVFVFGLFLMIVLYVRGVKGAVLISIVSATVLAVLVQAIAHLDRISESNPTGWGQTVPELKGSPVAVPVFDTLGKVDMLGGFGKLGAVSVVLLVFSLMLADFFDTMGTMVAVGAEGGLLDQDGNPPRTRQILVIDSLAAVVGGLGGVSSNTSYVESASGVAEGARTGLASVVTGVLFLLSTFLAPLVELVPTEAASTALVFVGFLMMTQVTDIDWKSPEVAIPSFMTIALMPFGYSVSVGIGVGFVTHSLVQLATGRARRVHPLLWVVSALFVVYFLIGPIQRLLGVA